MQTTRSVCGIALVLALAATAAAVGESVTPLQGKAKFGAARRSGAPQHTLKLGLLVNPSFRLDIHDPSQHDLFVSLGGTTLVDAPAGSDGYRWKRDGRWRCKADGAGGRVVVKADGLTGRMTIKVRRADLHDLRDGDGTDLPLVLDVGGTVFEGTLSFDVRRGRVTRWAGFRGHTGGGGPPAPPGGPGGPVAYTTQSQGIRSGIRVADRRIVTSQAQWSALWSVHQYGGGPPPALDFQHDMLIALVLGWTAETGDPSLTDMIRVVGVNDSSTRREVVWEVVPDGAPNPCGPSSGFAPCFPASTYHFVVVPASPLPVTFRQQ